MSSHKKFKKRYLITILSIVCAILSVVLLHMLDTNFAREKIIIEKEIKAILEFNKEIFTETITSNNQKEKTKILRDSFASKISYKKLLNTKEDFKNFKYLPPKEILGFKLLNNAQLGFFYDNNECPNTQSYCAGIIVDINSHAKPNRFGDDQFFYKVGPNGIIHE